MVFISYCDTCDRHTVHEAVDQFIGTVSYGVIDFWARCQGCRKLKEFTMSVNDISKIILDP